MSSFFETRIESLKTPASPPAVRSLPRKKKKKSAKKQKAVSFEDSKEDFSDDKKEAIRNSASIMKSAVILLTNVL